VRLVLDVTRADLAPHTTLRLGGPAGRLVVASIQDEILQIVRDGERAGGPPLVLAGGSNVVVSDAGVPGTVLLLRTTGIRPVTAGGAGPHGTAGDGEVLVTVEAGQNWDEVVAWAVAEGLVGIECLAGVPGSAGATPIQNVGAYGQEVADTIASVRVLDRTRGDVCDMSPAECRFAYRSSVFRHNDRYVVLAVTFRLRRGGMSAPIRYAELARALGVAVGASVPLAQARSAVLALRAGKGMVLDPSDPDTYSVGSFFVNPVLDRSAYASLRTRAVEAIGEEPAGWPVDWAAPTDGAVKVSAAWLIERAGFGKGYAGSHGGVSISTKHTLALTNRGTGTAAALIGLAREIRDGVAKAFDVELRPEPVLIGCVL
jgi:UDP-N-acetylmuramate dehydrogenase